MAHPLQPHFDHVSVLLRELRAVLEDHVVFRSRREAFDEYLEMNELELALHSACDVLLESPFDKPSAEVLKKIEDLHKAMELRDDCVETSPVLIWDLAKLCSGSSAWKLAESDFPG